MASRRHSFNAFQFVVISIVFIIGIVVTDVAITFNGGHPRDNDDDDNDDGNNAGDMGKRVATSVWK